MKTIWRFILIFSMTGLFWQSHAMIEPGKVASGFRLQSLDGQTITLEQFKHPYAQALQVWISASPIYFGSPELIAADDPFQLPVPIS